MISEETKAAPQLPISTGLDVAPDMNIDALSVGHEYLMLPEICVKFSQTPADARAKKGFLAILVNDSVIVASESHFQVQLDVRTARRRCSAVLMASGPNGNGNMLGFGVLKSEYNVVLILRLYDQRWVHAAFCFVAGCCILVPHFLIVLGSY